MCATALLCTLTAEPPCSNETKIKAVPAVGLIMCISLNGASPAATLFKVILAGFHVMYIWPATIGLTTPLSVASTVIGAPIGLQEPALFVSASTGTAAVYVNDAAAVNDPAGVVTTTSLAPEVEENGVTAVICVAETTTRLVAATPPIFTLVAPVKLVPVSVKAVPPNCEPYVGLTLAMVGGLTTVIKK